jgi:hypothetical protein
MLAARKNKGVPACRMGTRKQVVAEQLLEFATVVGDRHLIAVTVGPSLDPILLSLGQTPDYRVHKARASFPKRRAASPNRFRVHFQAGEEWLGIDLAETNENYHAVQPLPAGKWLLVRGRATDEQDHNAHVHAPDGLWLGSLHAGDGIEDVQAAVGGNVWVSYFDEGVFGDTALGQSGLVCFDQGGQPVFRLDELGDPILRSMADCYALNVCSAREVWLYFYTDFPLVRLLDRKVAGHWMMPIAGSHAFAVDGERVLLAGSYDHAGTLFLGRLDKLDFEEVTPVNEEGLPLRKFSAFGRRHRLYLATEDAVHVVDLRNM